jgi:hypothetical protein
MPFLFVYFADPMRDIVVKERPSEDECVVLTLLSRRVHARIHRDLRCKFSVQFSPQPIASAARQVHADDASAVAAREHFVHQIARRITPERLDVLEAARSGSFLVPGAHVRKVDVAEHDAADTVCDQFIETIEERRLEPSRCGEGWISSSPSASA